MTFNFAKSERENVRCGTTARRSARDGPREARTPRPYLTASCRPTSSRKPPTLWYGRSSRLHPRARFRRPGKLYPRTRRPRRLRALCAVQPFAGPLRLGPGGPVVRAHATAHGQSRGVRLAAQPELHARPQRWRSAREHGLPLGRARVQAAPL